MVQLIRIIICKLNFVLIRSNMVGMEYILLHVQDPILYVIRKQHRHSPTEATPMADYYIIAGTIYQAPDLASVFNSRLVSSLLLLNVVFFVTKISRRRNFEEIKTHEH